MVLVADSFRDLLIACRCFQRALVFDGYPEHLLFKSELGNRVIVFVSGVPMT